MVEGVEAGARGLAAEAVAAGAGHHGLCPGQPRLGAGPAARVEAEEAGGEEAGGADGEVKSIRPVSVANQTQCCGGLKSGVCTLI